MRVDLVSIYGNDESVTEGGVGRADVVDESPRELGILLPEFIQELLVESSIRVEMNDSSSGGIGVVVGVDERDR